MGLNEDEAKRGRTGKGLRLYLESSEDSLTGFKCKGTAEQVCIQQDPWHDRVDCRQEVYKTRQEDLTEQTLKPHVLRHRLSLGKEEDQETLPGQRQQIQPPEGTGQSRYIPDTSSIHGMFNFLTVYCLPNSTAIFHIK